VFTKAVSKLSFVESYLISENTFQYCFQRYLFRRIWSTLFIRPSMAQQNA